jgi:hypothetical protein
MSWAAIANTAWGERCGAVPGDPPPVSPRATRRGGEGQLGLPVVVVCCRCVQWAWATPPRGQGLGEVLTPPAGAASRKVSGRRLVAPKLVPRAKKSLEFLGIAQRSSWIAF